MRAALAVVYERRMVATVSSLFEQTSFKWPYFPLVTRRGSKSHKDRETTPKKVREYEKHNQCSGQITEKKKNLNKDKNKFTRIYLGKDKKNGLL